MAIIFNFTEIKAGLERLEAEKTPVTLTEKHPLLLDAVIAHQRKDRTELLPPEPVVSWVNITDYIEVDRRIYTLEEISEAWGKQIANGMFGNFPGSPFVKKAPAE